MLLDYGEGYWRYGSPPGDISHKIEKGAGSRLSPSADDVPPRRRPADAYDEDEYDGDSDDEAMSVGY